MPDHEHPLQHSNVRSTVEIGAAITVLFAVVGLAFNAGVEYNRVSSLQSGQETNAARIGKLEDTSTQVGQTLVELRTLMQQVRDNQRQMQQDERKRRGG